MPTARAMPWLLIAALILITSASLAIATGLASQEDLLAQVEDAANDVVVCMRDAGYEGNAVLEPDGLFSFTFDTEREGLDGSFQQCRDVHYRQLELTWADEWGALWKEHPVPQKLMDCLEREGIDTKRSEIPLRQASENQPQVFRSCVREVYRSIR